MSYPYADEALTLGSYKYYTYADYQSDRQKRAQSKYDYYSRVTPPAESFTISRADKNGEPIIATRFAKNPNDALRSYIEAQSDAKAQNGKSFFVRSVNTNKVWKLTTDVATTTKVQVRSGNTTN